MLAEQTPGALRRVRPARARRRDAARAAVSASAAGLLETDVPAAARPHPADPRARRRRAVAGRRRGRRRQGPDARRTDRASARGWSRSSASRTIDAVVVGYRPGKEDGTVGSLILGLYDDGGKLRVVGHSSGLRAAEKRDAGRASSRRTRPARRGHGDPSRWKSEKELEWVDAAPGAGRRGHLRPRQRRPHPPRHQDPALARGQGAAGVQARADEVGRWRGGRTPRGAARPPSGR